MKKYFILTFLVIILCFLAFLFVHRPGQRVDVGQTNATSYTPSVLPREGGTTSGEKTDAGSNSSTKPATRKEAETNVMKPAIDPRFLSAWQATINFYGKVVDEKNNPVPEANVSFAWSELPTDDGERFANTKSDTNGLFSLFGKQGRSLSVSINKEGYYTSHGGHWGFNYALGPDMLTPDPSNPVIFHLRKMGQPQNLITKTFPPGAGQIWQLHHDGTPINLDLFNGTQTSPGSGQVKLEFWRDVSNRKANVFDWKLQISILGGGLAQTDEEFAFIAPETGYKPAIVIDMPATNEKWQTELKTKCYIEMPNGDYGEFELHLLAYNGVFTVHSAINPTGSRNLEPQ